MKLFTLNVHGLVEENHEEKQKELVRGICDNCPCILALQEVNQSISTKVVSGKQLKNYYPCGERISIRQDNYVWAIVEALRERGLDYYWTWLPLKIGYGKYEEGLALMSRSPIRATDVFFVSRVKDFTNWKTRKLLGISLEDSPEEWFYSVHYGWWKDEEEPFLGQWEKTKSHLAEKKPVWLMGDFNNPAEVRNEGYDTITSSGWQDTFLLAKERDEGITVEKTIDGWKEKETKADSMRIDQIWCNDKVEIESSKVIFNEKNYKIVSDHYGVLVDVRRKNESI